MSRTPDPRLHKLLGGEGLAKLRLRLRRHFERVDLGAPPGVVRLGSLSALEHETLALLTGRAPGTAKSMSVDMAQLDAALHNAGIAASLRDALEQLDGPIAHLATARVATLSSWSTAMAEAKHPGLTALLQVPAAQGLLKRLSNQEPAAAKRLLEGADAVLLRLPCEGLARAQLAAETLGNAHALDAGRPIATLVLAAWRQFESRKPNPVDLEENSGVLREERVRDVWARAGILVNELARPALFLNMPVRASDAGRWTPGEPDYLSLRKLLRAPPVWDVTGRKVFICENPNLVAIAADSLGAGCAPLVCTEGMPAAAQRTLLTQLKDAGAHLLYHGDFDWPGLSIANHVMQAYGAQPWRFCAQDYEAAVVDAPHVQKDLPDSSMEATWDPALASCMRRHGLSIAEEGLAASLLPDLARQR